MSPILRTAAATHVGLVRTNNEDSWHAGDRLLVVADGVGGMPAGEFASHIVVRTFAPLGDAEPAGAEGTGPAERTVDELRAALVRANDEINEESQADPARDGMGTTVTALRLTGDQLALIHVGDSRAYRLRDGAFEQLTRDDTYVQVLVDEGVLSRWEARHHPQRSIVTKAVAGRPLEPTTAVLGTESGDRYLVCSDGLSDYVTDDAIHEALKTHSDLQQCADTLVALTLQAGAPDNVTVVLADVVDA